MTGRQKYKCILLMLMALFILSPAIVSFAGTVNYEYDELNRLKTEEYPDGTKIEYIYDRLGNRTNKIVTLPMYTVSALVAEGAGSISPASVKVQKGGNTTFAVTPNPGYHIVSVTGCGGTLSGNNYTTGAITDNCTVSAGFAINVYNLTVSLVTLPAGVAGGAVSCDGTDCASSYNHGTQLTLTANANMDYEFTGWSGACSGTGVCIINMDSTKNIAAEFRRTYTITAIADPNGTVLAVDLTPFSTESKLGEVWNEIWHYYKVRYGDSVKFTVTPFPDAVIADVKADGSSLPLDNIRKYREHTFENIADTHTIKGYFACENTPPPARINGSTPVYYDSVQAAYNEAQNGNVIQTLAQNFTGNLTIGKSVTIDGGYGCSYKAEYRNGSLSGIKGMLHVSGGTSRIKYIKLYK